MPRIRHWKELNLCRPPGEHRYLHIDSLFNTQAEWHLIETILMVLYSASSDIPPDKRWRFMFDKSETFLDCCTISETLPAWLTEADLEFCTEEFKRTGFRGGLSWYRNLDRNWELTRFLSGAKIRQPSLFVAGEFDPVVTIYQQASTAWRKLCRA
jgi:hypothetical protein